MAKERLSLYFDTDVPIEKLMWDYICKDGRNRKSYNVKKAIEMVINGIEFKPSPTAAYHTEEEESEEPMIIASSDDDIDDEDLPF